MAIKNVGPDPRKVVRIGMLGCGFMGKCHSNAYKKIPYIYPAANVMPRLALLCDKDEKKVEREAIRYGFERFCTDWNEAAADADIDVFDNCGPDPVHMEPSIAALKNGKHVICEKPMAVSAADARRMRDAAAAATGKAVCTFNYRFMPAVRMAKDLIASGKMGKIYHIRVNYLQMAGHDPTLPADAVWYAAWPHSGGLQGIGSHAIDQCRYLIGEIKSLSAIVRTFNTGRARPSAGDPKVTSDEGTAAVLDFENGAIGVLESSVVATGRKNWLSWEINASKGSLRWDLEHPNSLWVCQAENPDNATFGFTEVNVTESFHPYAGAWWPSGHNIGWEHCHIIEKFLFIDAVANNKPLSPVSATFEDGYRVATIIEAMRRSSDSGQRVAIEY
jgi:predicted dehydrogenase